MTTQVLGLTYPPSAGRNYTRMQLDFVGGVAAEAARHGYDILLSSAESPEAASFQRLVEPGRVDGVIVLDVRLADDRVEYLAATGFPFVTIGRTRKADEAPWVDLDFAAMAAGCVRHLADLGHRRIAFVNRSEKLFRTGFGFAQRGLEGFTQAVADLGLTGEAYLCEDDPAAGLVCLEQILLDDPETSAVVTMNEAALDGLHLGLIRSGRAVPRDFSVVGVAAGPWAEQASPPLTAADIPAEEMACTAVELMVERLASPTAGNRQVLLKPLISLRSSTGPFNPLPGTPTDLLDRFLDEFGEEP